MQIRQQFYPDIETKFDHLVSHMHDKNNVTAELIKIMRGICDLELFYSSSLDKFANSISKLLLGKDPIKDILIIYERIISTKSEESSKIAQEIKDDLIPFLEGSIDLKSQQKLKDQQKEVKDIRFKMQKKLRCLYSSEQTFRQTIYDTKNTTNSLNYSDRQSIQQDYKKRQLQFSDAIDSFNASIDDYMLKYSELCEELSTIQTQRKMSFRDAISKAVIFEMNNIKNLEYNLARYMESLNKVEGKLQIQDRLMVGGQPFYDRNENGGMIQLAKLSNKNYIDHVVGKKKMEVIISEQEKKFRELRSAVPEGPVHEEKYHQMAGLLFKILDYANQHIDAPLLKQIVLFSKEIYYELGSLKIELLTALLCHEIFRSTRLWEAYDRRLSQKIGKQAIAYLPQSERAQILSNLLKRDLQFLKLIEINPLITNLISKFTPALTDDRSSTEMQRPDSKPAKQESVKNMSLGGSKIAIDLFQ